MLPRPPPQLEGLQVLFRCPRILVCHGSTRMVALVRRPANHPSTCPLGHRVSAGLLKELCCVLQLCDHNSWCTPGALDVMRVLYTCCMSVLALRHVTVRCRAGGGPLTVRLSELSLMELQRLAALAGAQWSAALPAADQTPAEPGPDVACGDGGRDAHAHAPITLANHCPMALEVGQVIKHWLTLCMEVKAISSICSLGQRSSFMQQRCMFAQAKKCLFTSPNRTCIMRNHLHARHRTGARVCR